MSEDHEDETRRLNVEAAVFKRLDKRREEKSAKYAMNQTAREEQKSENVAVLAEIDAWVARLTDTISGKVRNDVMSGDADDIVAKTLFLDNLAEDMHKLDAYFAEKANVLAAYDVKRIQNLIIVRCLYCKSFIGSGFLQQFTARLVTERSWVQFPLGVVLFS